jgi:hypothetical protein
MATFNIRPSDLLLDRVLNPTRDADIGSATPALIIEACGIIPDFFAHACMAADPLTLDEIAHHMDEAYQFGGFRYPFGGSVTPAGVYQSSHDDDPDMPPLARFLFDTDPGGFECFVYHYGIAAIRDRATGETKIARFD